MAMELNTTEKTSEIRPVPVYLYEPPDRESEISLADLWKAIARRKWLALLGFIATLLLTVLYLFNAEPVFRATAHLLPPQHSIQGLLADASGYESIEIESFTPKYVFNKFLDNLKSRGVRREFFDSHNLLDHYVSAEDKKNINKELVFDTRFNRNLLLKVDGNASSIFIVSFSDTDPELAAQWVNQFVKFADERTIQQLFSDVDAVLQAEMKQIRNQLSSKLKLAEQRRFDKITVLREALHIAAVLGIKDASAVPSMMGKTSTGLAVNTAEVPLYMRGIEALETEISVIESRKSDEPFISGFRDLQERLALMETISIDPTSLSAVTVDDLARVPYRAEGPRKKMIAVLGVALGIMVGIFLALTAELLLGARRKFGR